MDSLKDSANRILLILWYLMLLCILQCTTDDLMRFVKELRQANSALVDAFEKSKKRQQAEKRRMKQDLVSYMNRVQNSSIPAIDVSTNNYL